MSPNNSIDTTVFQPIQALLAQSKTIAPIYKAKKLLTYWKVGQLMAKAAKDATSIKLLQQWLKTAQHLDLSIHFLEEVLLFYTYYPDRKRLRFELSWSHYQQLIKVAAKVDRAFYTTQAAQEAWTVQQLRRQIKTRYTERLLHYPTRVAMDSQLVIKQAIPAFLKHYYLLEFLPITSTATLVERDLENAITNDLPAFLLELGSGFAFVSQQQRIVAPTGKCFYIDLVFYNYLYNCFVLIELKTGTLSHQDVGQLDMYVRLVDEKWRQAIDRPTIGLLLCAQLDETIIRYSALHDHPQLYAANYVFEMMNDK